MQPKAVLLGIENYLDALLPGERLKRLPNRFGAYLNAGLLMYYLFTMSLLASALLLPGGWYPHTVTGILFVGIAAVYFYLGAFTKLLSQLGFRACPPRWVWIALALIFLFRLWSALSITAIVALFPHANISMHQAEVSKTFDETQALWPAIEIALLIPIYEEILFRGLLFQGLRKWLRSPVKAMLISGGLFGLAHGSAIQFVLLGAVGIVSAWLFDKSKSIWPSIVMHVATNSLSVLLVIAGSWWATK